MRLLLLPAVVVACATAVPAQQQPRKPEAAAAYKALVAEYDAARDAWTSARREVAKTDEYQKLVKARDYDGANALLAKVPPIDYAALRERFLAEAKKYAGTDDAVDFLTWVAMYGGDKDAQTAAANTLLEKYIESRELITLAENARYLAQPLGKEGYQVFCNRLADGSPDNMVRAWALYSGASAVQRDRDATPAEKERAEAELAQAEKLAEGTLLADVINGPRFQQERLQIGMEAPDIVAEDLDGVPFKLSDYRGKVVVLDFWGDW